ncbi:MAG: hypothetical protein IKM97_04475 [Clostridia bacterium]|nr:hypothetical protein [Clostridia bacterium]
MNEDKSNIKDSKLEFNTYCIFTEDKQDIGNTIGLVFKDYLENIKVKNK